MRFALPRPHQLARTNYRPRALSFVATFLIVLLMAWEGQISWSVIPVAALQFLVYPHLVYLRACLARDSKRAELNNLTLDALLLGAWTAEFQFKWWLLFAFFISVCMNNTVIRGMRGALLTCAGFIVGVVVWGARLSVSAGNQPDRHAGLHDLPCSLYFTSGPAGPQPE